MLAAECVTNYLHLDPKGIFVLAATPLAGGILHGPLLISTP